MDTLNTGLHIFWYVIFIASIVFYSVLDGFDLGVGILNLFHKTDTERRIGLNAIGPVWDGNEVWLIVLAGGLFAGFPGAYATLLSSFYMPVTLLIAALIFRAVAIEFRSKKEGRRWRAIWDFCFFAGSLGIALGAGMVLGNMIRGIPLDNEFEYAGTIGEFFNPYSLLVGVTAIACFTMHGAIFLVMKTEGEMHDKMRRWTRPLTYLFVLCYVATTLCTVIYYPEMTHKMSLSNWFYVIPVVSFLFILNIPFQMARHNDGWAFISSSLSIALLLILYGVGMFPNLVRSSLSPETNSVTIYNAGSSEMTLIVLAIIVGIGLPLVVAYGLILYRIFRGKVKVMIY